MADSARTPEEVRREIEAQRDELAQSVDTLREEIGEATDIAGKLRANLPVAAAAALRRSSKLWYGTPLILAQCSSVEATAPGP